MSARPTRTVVLTATAGDPLASLRAPAAAFADLAFGSLTADASVLGDGHLAILPADALELDLSDPAQRRFGDYELRELIGRGGMGVVYRAYQHSLDREVAVKLLAAGPWASREFIERFRHEAQNAARMQHPNIVAIFEVGAAEEMHFFSMRMVHGGSLAALLKREGRLQPRRAAQLLRSIAEAVDYAHRLGVLHLDLKPANVLLDENGAPHVADFGLARRLDHDLSTTNTEVSGTPSYMAPEQAIAGPQKITPATDIWGLGAILFELVTGEPPFLGETPQDTLQLVVNGTVRSPRRFVPNLPRDLEAIILKCMAHEVAGRYASGRELADDLNRYLEGRAVRARPLNVAQRAARWARREPKLAATALLAFAAVLVGLAATTRQWQRADRNANVAVENLWTARAQAAQNALGEGNGFHALRPLIANLTEMEAAGRRDEARIERERIGTILANAPQLLDFVSLRPGELATSLAIAPDGRHFAAATFERSQDGGTWRVRQYDMTTLRETWSTVTNDHTFLGGFGDYALPHGGLRYTADGRFLLVSMQVTPVLPAPRRSDMIAFDTRDGRILWPTGISGKWADIVYDDAVKVALVRFRSDASLRWPDSAQFYAVDGWHPLGPRHASSSTLAADFWLPAPDGKSWLGTRDSARVAMFEVPDLKPRWQLVVPQTSLVRAWQFSHDGRRIALGSVDGTVRLVDSATGHTRQLTSAPAGRVQAVKFSNDDRTLAALDENGQFWSWDTGTGAPRSAPTSLLRTGVDAADLRYDGDTVFGAGLIGNDAQMSYVALAPHAPFGNEALLGTARFTGLAPDAVFDVSDSAQRMVTASITNLIEIWQLPAPSLLGAHAAPLPADVPSFDGTRVVTVDGEFARVLDAATSTPLSPILHFPDPVRFAELTPDGRTLAVLAGRTLRIVDPETRNLRTTLVLEQTPQRVAIAKDAPILVLTTAHYAGDVLRERIQRIDLEHGTFLGADAEVDALDLFQIDAHARHALLQTWNTLTHEFAGPFYIMLDDGRSTCQPALDSVRAFAIAPDGGSAWFDVAANGESSLHRWDMTACREMAVYDRHQRETVTPVLLARADGSVVVHRAGHSALLMIDANGIQIAALGGAIPGAMHDFVLSADGARAAFATRNAIHVVDARHGRRLTAPLGAAIAGDDAIAKLAFSPDGSRLLARTINGRWLFRELPESNLDTTNLQRMARVLDAQPGDVLSARDLATLRTQLPGAAWVRAIPKSPAEARIAPGDYVDAAGTQIDPRFVPIDLRAAINTPLTGSVWSEPHARGDRPTLAPGMQRYLGVDYRIDGGVQLSGGGTATALGPEMHRSTVVAVPDVVASRVHALAFMHIPLNPGMPPRNFAYIVLTGPDGHETRLTVRTIRDVVTDVSPALAQAGARIALMGTSSAFIREGEPVVPASAVFAVTLDVPPGTGPIHSLRLDVADGPMEAPLFYAVTLERPAAKSLAKGVQP